MSPKASSAGAFVRGVDASTGLLLQPRGSVPRASNLLLTKRGSLRTCDGSQIVNAYNGVPTPNRGKGICVFMFAPIGVDRYYLFISKSNDFPLGPPQNVVAVDAGTGGSFAAGTYYWTVIALDGAGGETTAATVGSAAIAAGHKATVTWNYLPNAVEYLLFRSNVPVGGNIGTVAAIAQPAPGSATVSFTDLGGPTAPTLPPTTDTTQQTVMYAMPPAGGAISYNEQNNLVALWPADVLPRPIPIPDGSVGGGSGGQGTTGPGNVGAPGPTPSGGVPGNVTFIPQIVQFINQAVIALGNGYPIQIYSDPNGTPDNPAFRVQITNIAVDIFGVVTVNTATPHGLTPGSCCIVNAPDFRYTGVHQVITVPSATSFTYASLAARGAPAETSGQVVSSTIPVVSTFQAQFPTWVAKTSYPIGTVVVPTAANGFYYRVIGPSAGGTSGATQPVFPTTIGAIVQDNDIKWQNAGSTSSSAPPPPGAGHITVYAGALWVWDTSPTNTANGLDGPSCLRMSDVNNPNSWNPVNQAFLDKDDGTEGMGLAVFTIAAQGIPPQGSLIACKLVSTFQIVGVFGSSNFMIQRATTEMGCIAPRTLQFIPGYGIGRMTHLGVAVFDSVNDRLISPQIAPYLFPTNDPELSDIVVADSNWMFTAQGVQTANPAMYCVFIPVGVSNGALTRALCFDLVLKAWNVVDLPFPVSACEQAIGTTSNAVTIIASYSDGTLQRWQAGDVTWATAAAGVNVAAAIAGMLRSTSVASKDPDQRLYGRRVVVRGQVGNAPVGPMIVQPRAMGKVINIGQQVVLPSTGEFVVEAVIGVTSSRFDAILKFQGAIVIDDVGIHVDPKPLGSLVSSFA